MAESFQFFLLANFIIEIRIERSLVAVLLQDDKRSLFPYCTFETTSTSCCPNISFKFKCRDVKLGGKFLCVMCHAVFECEQCGWC